MKTFACWALLALAAAPAGAQTAPAPAAATPAVDPALVAKSQELMRAMRAEEQTQKMLDTQMNQMMKGLTDRVFASMPATAATKDPEFREIMRRYMDRMSRDLGANMKRLMPEMIARMTTIYARNLTARELDDLIVFYRSPTGQAFVEKMPKIMGAVMIETQDVIMKPVMASVQGSAQQLNTELQAWAAKHPELNKASKP